MGIYQRRVFLDSKEFIPRKTRKKKRNPTEMVIHIGEKTHHQDQSIFLVNLRTRNMSVIIVGKPRLIFMVI